MSKQFTSARKREVEYHQNFYEKNSLFSENTWLSNPAQFIIDSFKLIPNKKQFALDLGCGVGRHSIPLAKKIKKVGGEVVCIDLLPIAIEVLESNSKKHLVYDLIKPIVADIENFTIKLNHFDYIISASCIEHVPNILVLEKIIKNMILGTKLNGVNCIMMNTNIKWEEVETGKRIKPIVELNISTDTAINLLHKLYSSWTIKKLSVKKWKIKEQHKDKQFYFKSDCLCFLAMKNN